MKEDSDPSEAADHFTTVHPVSEGMEFDSFLDTGIIEKIEVYTKSELHVCFQCGKMKAMDCSGKS